MIFNDSYPLPIFYNSNVTFYQKLCFYNEIDVSYLEEFDEDDGDGDL